MTFIPHTDADREVMLTAIGVERLEALCSDIPERFRFPTLDLPAARSELEVERELRELAADSARLVERPGFLGAGTYRHFIPATVDSVLQRGELFTSYTPYQPEISQGFLQATFEFQSMVCELTGMDVSTASHYDGATALAEAVLLALAVGGGKRTKIVASASLHPQYREVVATYLRGTSAELVTPPAADSDVTTIASLLDGDTAACIVQSPNYFGQFEPVDQLADRASESRLPSEAPTSASWLPGKRTCAARPAGWWARPSTRRADAVMCSRWLPASNISAAQRPRATSAPTRR
jgi:glycine dehydrogenase subunit 1